MSDYRPTDLKQAAAILEDLAAERERNRSAPAWFVAYCQGAAAAFRTVAQKPAKGSARP